jgi:hypothetical protein
MAGGAQRSAAQAQNSSAKGAIVLFFPCTPVLAPGGVIPDQYTPSTPRNPSPMRYPQTPARPETEFEQMVANSAGRSLPLLQISTDQDPKHVFSN